MAAVPCFRSGTLAKTCHCEERSDEAIQGRTCGSGLLRFARNDRETVQVSTNPVVDPLAAESLCPWGSARYDSELISIRRDEVRLNSLASLPSVARYSASGSASAEAISFTALS